jgi:RNA polymerase sigma-70 factor, ECF subfamily
VSTNPETDPAGEFLAQYDHALPEVYGYLLHRCGHSAVAEDLTSEVFLAAARAVRQGTVRHLTVAWLIGIARHKLIDHWRWQAREERGLDLVIAGMLHAEPPALETVAEGQAHETLTRLPAQYRAALVLRYVDGLSVPEVAAALGRSVHATESVLARARSAFRRLYVEANDG